MKQTRRVAPGASKLLALVAILVCAAAGWTLSRPLSESQQIRRQFSELQRQVANARQTRAARATDRGRIMRLRAQARTAAEAERTTFEREASDIEARLGWGDPATVRAAVRSGMFVPLSRNTQLHDIVPASTVNENGCVACHVAIATPGLESFPPPFGTHPALSSYVGAQSPHAPSRIRCASCHQGDGQATTFASAGHSTVSSAPGTQAATSRRWADINAPGAMLPRQRIEAACVGCHAGEIYQPGAPRLNEALVTFQRAGCDVCHDTSAPERAGKRGPDLRRIGAKLSPDWVRAWLANPRAVKPATWMPRFWTADTLSDEDRAAVDAVTTYLFANSEGYTPAVASPPRGDAQRGKALVESVGCLGCHIVGADARDQSSVRRTFGQPLDGLGNKTSYPWLVDWVRDPSRFSSDTRMPSLRLDPQQAADVATYLTTLTREVPQQPAPDAADDRYRAVIQRYAVSGSTEAADAREMTGTPLRVLAGRTVIGALGCVNCHAIQGFEQRRSTVPIPARPVWLDADARAVHHAAVSRAERPTAAPDLGLGEIESGRIALALTAVAGRSFDAHAMSMPWQVQKAAGRRLVQERNCVGCHAVDGTGGDFVNLVEEPTLGPPLLTPEGSSVQPAWLRNFLRHPTTIRPWLSARMPTFNLSDDEVTRVGEYLRAIALPTPEPSPLPPGVTAAAGKELFELLKCQQCHVLGEIPKDQPTSNLAPDLRMARERLQPEWILSWLRNPSAILPGTRMPTFWPDYPKSFYPAFDKDGSRQIRAIREHLLTLR